MNKKIFDNAINDFRKKINIWELNHYQKKLLSLSENGNCGAFCELLTSSHINGDSCFDAFYAELNMDGADYD